MNETADQPPRSAPEDGAGCARIERFEAEALPHLDCVFRVACQHVGDRATAEDLTQEVFLKAYRKFHQYELGTNARAWLLTILRRQLIDQRRRAGVRPSLLPLHAAAEPPARRPDPSLAAPSYDRDDFDGSVVRELDELPEEFRQALLLCDVEGMSYAEIAEVMDTPVGTVRSRISRARRQLRERLADRAAELGIVRQPQEQA